MKLNPDVSKDIPTSQSDIKVENSDTDIATLQSEINYEVNEVRDS